MTASVDAGGDIRQSVIITGDGSSASLRFGDEFVLPLDRRQIAPPKRRAGGGYNPLPLLVPDANALPLVGRKALLKALRIWLDKDIDVSVLTLIARAGTGKTRLAIELCKAVDDGDEPGSGAWDAGFIRPSDLASVIDRLATHSFDWQRPTLLVLDYAAAVHRELAKWLDRLASEAFVGRLRLLLLDREAPQGFGWWHDLTHPSDNRAATRCDLFVDPDRPQMLPDIDPGEERWAVVEAARAATAAMLADGAQSHGLPPPGTDPAFDAAIAAPRFGNPLNLAMAGLIAAERGPTAALALRRLDAARLLARHELGRMARIAKGEDIAEGAIRHALGFNGLAGGLALAPLRRDLEAELKSAGLRSESAAIAELLMQELPSQGNQAGEVSEPRLGTIQPDLIGEGVIVEALLVGAPDRALNAAGVVERAYACTGARAAEALMRLIQDYGHALEDSHADDEERDVARVILGLLVALAATIPDEEIQSLETLVFAFPENTTIMREAAATQTNRVATFWRALAKSVDESDPDVADDIKTFARGRAAGWLNNLSIRLGDLGQRDAALTAAREAVEFSRILALVDSESARSHLAMSLNSLANRLSEVGHPEEALEAAHEAVEIRRLLAADQPDDYAPDLALSLNNLANRLSDLGRREPALTVALEAVGLFRTLAVAHHKVFTPKLSVALANLSARLSDMGQLESALAAAQEATNLCRILAAEWPDSFTPALALSLNNLGNRLAGTDRNEEALAVAQESVGLYRDLAANRPDVFIPRLAATLNNLCARLSVAGDEKAALAVVQESVSLRRTLVAAQPEIFAPDLASSLNNLAIRLSKFGRSDAALEAAKEAVDLYSGLVANRPGVYEPNLAKSLFVLGDRLEEVGRMNEAVDVSYRSVATLLQAFLSQPAAFAQVMRLYLGGYIRRSQVAEIEIDKVLVEAILEILLPMIEGNEE